MSNAKRVSTNDEHLFDVLSSEGSIEGFLDSVFSFLRRRSDFFFRNDLESTTSLIKLLLRKYSDIKDSGDKPKEMPKRGVPVATNPAQFRETAFTNIRGKSSRCSQSETVEDSPVAPAQLPRKDINDIVIQSKVKDSESYNGANCENYSWSQTINELDVMVPVTTNVTSRIHVRVFIRSNDLTVVVNEGGTWSNKIDGRFCHQIRPTNSIWTFHPGSHVHVSLEKERERWWEALMVNESQLDKGKMDRSVRLEELTPEAQSMVQKLAYQQYIQQRRKFSEGPPPINN